MTSPPSTDALVISPRPSVSGSFGPTKTRPRKHNEFRFRYTDGHQSSPPPPPPPPPPPDPNPPPAAFPAPPPIVQGALENLSGLKKRITLTQAILNLSDNDLKEHIRQFALGFYGDVAKEEQVDAVAHLV
ncbi:hypothetical protein PGTUg99_032305 [Puccinia graminis f. sp. tritici]|uniref:Uncharacterized protein n=1 Tax=Puccinia graminis f. sp. tritici TaxID=56615 RepID=A0A5B0R9L8_PUCGR|nr:hypothetical protein PGTUg99_032305 [Puccinia graminis f. sp. tritici]